LRLLNGDFGEQSMTNETDHKPPQIIIYETDDKVARSASALRMKPSG